MSARRGPAREFSPRLRMRLTVVSIAQRTWKATAGCSCSAPSRDREMLFLGARIYLAVNRQTTPRHARRRLRGSMLIRSLTAPVMRVCNPDIDRLLTLPKVHVDIVAQAAAENHQ